MNVSIIVPVVNEYNALKQLIPSLLEQNKTHNFDLIICDGGSSDLSHSYIRQLQETSDSFMTFKFVIGELGRAKQMNKGVQYARFEQLLFLHADTKLPNNWPYLMEATKWGRFDVCLSGKHYMLRLVEKMMNWRSCFTQVATGDQAIFVKKSLFNKVGGYPDIPLMEDIALSKLLRKQSSITCIKTPLVTSSRRWERNGVFKTIGLMWQLRFAYFCGQSPIKLAQKYYPNHQVKRRNAVIQVFTKLPILGFVKTRLIPQLGAQMATDIHRHLLKYTLSVVEQSAMDNELWVAQKSGHKLEQDEEFSDYKSKFQQGSDLGERMGFAIEQGLKAHTKVILIGSDCLDLTPKHMLQLLEALNEVDIALIPVEDGGFISIACRVFDYELFEHVAWGTSSALADVLINIKRLSLSYCLLEPVRDIDTYDDVAEYPSLLKLNS